VGHVAVVHNGIVENHRPLKERLREQGSVFISDTDTEVIVHLLNSFVSAGRTLEEATMLTVAELRGSYSFLALSDKEPGTLVGARLNSPLVVGVGEGEPFGDVGVVVGEDFIEEVFAFALGEGGGEAEGEAAGGVGGDFDFVALGVGVDHGGVVADGAAVGELGIANDAGGIILRGGHGTLVVDGLDDAFLGGAGGGTGGGDLQPQVERVGMPGVGRVALPRPCGRDVEVGDERVGSELDARPPEVVVPGMIEDRRLGVVGGEVEGRAAWPAPRVNGDRRGVGS